MLRRSDQLVLLVTFAQETDDVAGFRLGNGAANRLRAVVEPLPSGACAGEPGHRVLHDLLDRLPAGVIDRDVDDVGQRARDARHLGSLGTVALAATAEDAKYAFRAAVSDR